MSRPIASSSPACDPVNIVAFWRDAIPDEGPPGAWSAVVAYRVVRTARLPSATTIEWFAQALGDGVLMFASDP